MMLIVYPAVFHKEDDAYWVEFPDLKGLNTYGDTLEETLEYAKEALEGYCITILESGEALPNRSDIVSLKLTEDNTFAALVSCELKDLSQKSVKKTLTIPNWLNEAALKENVNFSQTLQEALMAKLHLK